MDLCETMGCGMSAVGRCVEPDCGRWCCRSHITVGLGGGWRRITNYEDRRIADLQRLPFEVVDISAMFDVWNADERTLCLMCRNNQLFTRRSDIVHVVDPGLPSPTGDAVADLRNLDRLQAEPSHATLENYLHRRLGDGFGQVVGAVESEIKARRQALQPALLALGQHAFARTWARVSGGEPYELKLGWLRRAWGHHVILGTYVGSDGEWYLPRKYWVDSYSHGVDGGNGYPIRWRRVHTLTPRQWELVVASLTSAPPRIRNDPSRSTEGL